MKIFIGLLAFLNILAFNTFANTLDPITQDILVATPGLPENIYREILAERKDLISPVQAALEKYQEQEVRPEIFTIADQCFLKKHCQSFAKNFEKLREQALLNPQERQLLLELWQKAGKTKDCYWEANSSCGLKKLALEKLGLDKEQNFIIFIDGLSYKAGEEIYLLPKRKYQWKIVSSRYQPKLAWATMEEIQSQVSLNNPYVTGGCLASSAVQGLNKEIIEHMYVAFDRTCVRRLGESSTAPLPLAIVGDSWVDRNKVWLISALALTVGAGYLMRDQQIEFSSPFK